MSLNNTDDTFLNFDAFKSLQGRVNTALASANKVLKFKRLDQLNKVLPFKSVFGNKGVNGVAGLCTLLPPRIKGNKFDTNFKDIDVVFKVGIAVNHAMENEVDILNELVKIRQWCPNIMGILGHIEAPISLTFIQQNEKEDEDSTLSERGKSDDSEDEDEKWELWDQDIDNLQSPIIFIEYISPLTFYHVCKLGDRQQILSSMYQSLAGLVMAQDACRVTHYDLHMDNVLLKECDPNIVLVYLFDQDRYFVTPTYGHLSVIIDWGNAHCGTLQNKRHRSSIQGYKNGHCGSRFDHTYDACHLLFSALYYLEERSERWRNLSTKLMMTFKDFPIWRQKGWRELNNSLMRELVARFTKSSKVAKHSELWTHYAYDIIEILTSLETIPFENHNVNFSEDDLDFIIGSNLDVILEEFCHLWDDDNCTHEFNIVKALKILVDEFYNIPKPSSQSDKAYKKVFATVAKTFQKQYSFILEKIPKAFDAVKVLQAICNFQGVMARVLSDSDKKNRDILAEAEKKCEISTTYQLLKQLEQWAGGESMRINQHTKYLVCDAINKKMWNFTANDINPKNLNKPLKLKKEIADLVKRKIFG